MQREARKKSQALIARSVGRDCVNECSVRMQLDNDAVLRQLERERERSVIFFFTLIKRTSLFHFYMVNTICIL